MKSKRQTVWLVSMLSLMVVLSAYYLFTEDAPVTPKTADGQQVTTMEKELGNETAVGTTLPGGSDVIVSEVVTEGEQGALTDDSGAAKSDVPQEDQAQDPAKDPESAAQDDKAAQESQKESQSTDNRSTEQPKSETSATSNDEDVLKEIEAQNGLGADTLTAYQFERSEANMKKQDELLKTINSEEKSLDEAAMAQQELSALEEKEEIIFDIEERLQQKYANAAVTESDDKYKVIVVSEKLEAKDAVGIMDLVMQELGVSQDKVSVQYVSQ